MSLLSSFGNRKYSFSVVILVMLKVVSFVVLLGFSEEVETIASLLMTPFTSDFEKHFCLFVVIPIFFYVIERKVGYYGDSVRSLYNSLREEEQF